MFGLVLITLTGARGSGGGSCSGSGSSSSSHGSGSDSGSSSTSGGSDYNGSDTDSSGSGSSSGGSSGGGSVAGAGSGSDRAAMRDIRIDSCQLDDTGKKLVARVTVTNDGSLDYDYDFTVQFKGDLGDSVATATARVDDFAVKASASRTTEASTAYTGGGDGSEYKKCVVSRAGRTMS